MRAVVLKENREVRVEEVEDPRIESPTDVIVRITSTGICGSDLHMYEGRTAAGPGLVMGHENMGVVEQVGPGVVNIRKGDRVVLPFNISCGSCFNCARGETHSCLVANPEQPHAAYGYAGMGPYRGGQAEFLRVPFADFNCLKLPGQPGDELEDDFLLLSDVFPTGYHATELARVGPGSTVAVFGAGPVGLLAGYSALLRGAAEVYVVDSVPERLAQVKQMGATPIDFTKGDPVEQIRELRRRNPLITGAMRPGEEKMLGVMCGIDAVGYQARDTRRADAHGGPERPTQVLEQLVELLNPTGTLGIVGVYMSPDPGAADEDARQGRFPLPWGKVFDKALTIGTGQCPVKRYNLFLRDLIISGRARPSFIVSHRLPLDEAASAYRKFDERRDGYTKVILKPGERPIARA
ncbi:glutathione-independent formaldehyde dehydrogenase [Archangium violaceum]|uniref:glutathione-independent formaldehyde dehydrogenase n=1 Tax=Archangium violaceum TaxID=83451 RepID=UPI00193C7C24|nr:glutathione-independent formaldehyde dehydrogenase [Archangium violaceum]QRK08354.1 glutathione-independent formaldehyde dehydrogenase [Archangium violaceum]